MRRRLLRRDSSGATLVEFAMVLPMLCMVLLGMFDLGYRIYVSAVMEGAMHEAARMATVGGITREQIKTRVEGRLREVSGGAVAVVTHSYNDFSDVGKPEKITEDTDPQLVYNEGDCFEDANEDGEYSLDRGIEGVGGAEDIVHYSVSVTYSRLVPLGSLLGWDDRQTVRGSTVLRNQPFAARTNGVEVICT